MIFYLWTGETHAKLAKEVSEDLEDDRALITCSSCNIQVTSEANLKLHKSLGLHRRKSAKNEEEEKSKAETMES